MSYTSYYISNTRAQCDIPIGFSGRFSKTHACRRARARDSLTCSFLSGSYLRANPKSIILIRLPSRVKHMMFSGFRSRWMMLFRCTNSIAWHTCRMNTAQARSDSTKSSSITRSNSSPPSTLRERAHIFRHSEWLVNAEVVFATDFSRRRMMFYGLLDVQQEACVGGQRSHCGA